MIDPERARGGDKFLSWLFPLHTGEAFGVGGRIFISLFGFVPLAFFVTGLVIWLKLRKKTKKTQQQIPRVLHSSAVDSRSVDNSPAEEPARQRRLP